VKVQALTLAHSTHSQTTIRPLPLDAYCKIYSEHGRVYNHGLSLSSKWHLHVSNDSIVAESRTDAEIHGFGWIREKLLEVSGTSFAPAAYRCFAPIGGCLYQKFLELLFPFTNISLKHNLKAVEQG
jgi:hypothetical protein